jgi:hypothetical protein
MELGRKVDIPGFLYEDGRIVFPDQTFYLCFGERMIMYWLMWPWFERYHRSEDNFLRFRSPSVRVIVVFYFPPHVV